MQQQVLTLLSRKDYVPGNVPELLAQLRWPPQRQQELQRILRQLESAGRIARTKGNRYILARAADLIPGRIQINRQGKGFLQPDDPGMKEIVIPESDTGTALHGDRVLVRRNLRPRGLRSDSSLRETGSVVRILERKRTQIVGTLQRGRQFLYVIPDDPRMPQDIYVPEPRDVGRKPNLGDKVVVELLEWESRHNNPEGEIIEVLGPPDAEGVDMLSVLRQYNLPLHFPKPVLAAARAFGNTVSDEELIGREDCRAHQVITIDPDDAKDFDDAFCLQRISTEQWKLWVHIADVSHYVTPGSPLDEEARKRGNSTYLVDRVIPMLPEALSNELCSLKPNVDRLTKCVEFLISNDGRVLSTKFYSAVIHSKRRFTYQEVFAILERKSPDATAGVSESIVRMLRDAHELAQKIRRLRFKHGSLALDFPETKIRLDERGRVSRIEKVENDVSHQLIEEFMLLANEAVASHLMSRNQRAIYRVHEEPDERRLAEFREEVLSYHIPCGNLTKRAEVQKLLSKLDTIPIGAALKIAFLRSLMRARYAVEPLGHYGLAKTKYAHFTSPIRRYADLVVHRALFQSGHGSVHSLKETAEHLSDTERNSSDAERDSKDVKLYAFLEAQLKLSQPPVYAALVTDVRNFGFFVDVSELAMSGLIHCSSLTDDFYEFDEARGTLTGRRTRRVFRLGDRVNVQIAKVDRFKKQVDFRLAREERVGAARSQTKARGASAAANKSHDHHSHSPKYREQRGDSNRDRSRYESRPQQWPSRRSKNRQPTRSQSSLPTDQSSRSSRENRSKSSRETFRVGPSRPQISSSHSRSKFRGRRRR